MEKTCPGLKSHRPTRASLGELFFDTFFLTKRGEPFPLETKSWLGKKNDPSTFVIGGSPSLPDNSHFSPYKHFVSLRNDLHTNLLSNHADDT